MDKNYLDLLRLLNEHEVRYLIIGGYAVVHYSEPRYTKDLDIWIDPSLLNAKRVLSALREFGAPIDNLTIKDLSTPGLIYIFGVPPLRVDLLNRPKGATFSQSWKSREKLKLGAVGANFIGLDNLIKLKKAAGRPQDLADLEKLKSEKKHRSK